MPMEISSVANDGGAQSGFAASPLWSPSPARVASSQMEAFRQRMAGKYSVPLKSYHDLWAWSTRQISTFWRETWIFTEILHSHPPTMDDPTVPVVDESVPMDMVPRWFPTARLNFARNLLRYRDDHPAIIYESEWGKDGRTLTYAQLYNLVISAAAAMRAAGILCGDTVAAFAANCPEVVVFMLAAASLGAIFTSISPDFGPTAALDRLAQTRPRLLLASPSVYYNGRVHDQMGKIRTLLAEIDSIERVVLVESSSSENEDSLQTFAQFIASHPTEGTASSLEMDFAELPFDHPLYILYSSGTTGKPKCLVHSAGGTLLQHKKEHMLQGDLRRSSVVLQYTTIGWMMWHWLVSVLSVGSTIVLYEGSPFRPGLLQLLELVDRHRVTHFGTSAKYLQHLQKDWQRSMRDQLDLSSLLTIYSTGSPLSAASFRFVHEALKDDLQLASITGGTDIISLFAGGNPLSPVYAGEIQGPCLGMAIAVYSEDGRDVGKSGEAGDLVCTRPFPSMPVALLGDTSERSLYRATYFERFPPIWHHGDFLQLNPTTGGLLMLGRSDATLNPAGVRFGSAELYNILSSSFPEVTDSLVVGVRREGDSDERVFMFLQTAQTLADPEAHLEASLVDRIKNTIRSRLSARHVPAVILPTPAVPYTQNGKKVEVAVKRILSGMASAKASAAAAATASTTSLANPESLQYYAKVASDPAYFSPH